MTILLQLNLIIDLQETKKNEGDDDTLHKYNL